MHGSFIFAAEIFKDCAALSDGVKSHDHTCEASRNLAGQVFRASAAEIGLIIPVLYIEIIAIITAPYN